MKITNLKKNFGQQKVLDSFNIELFKNEIVVFLGASGSGKTTLFNCISGLMKLNDGIIENKRNLSMVFQEDRLLPWYNCFDNVNIVCKNEFKTREMMELVGVTSEHFNKFPQELSGGMKKRVSIARALSVNWEHLLMDEPFTSINDNYKQPIISYLKKNKNNKTILIISHDIHFAFSIADRVILLKGPPLEIVKIFENFENNENELIDEVKRLL